MAFRVELSDRAQTDIAAIYDWLNSHQAGTAGERWFVARHALQATALVHEVYLRLVDVDRMTLTSRTHFLGVAATLMRQILVDHARRQRADKRGGGATMLSLDEVSPAAQASSVDVLALDQALDALSSIDERQCRVVELRFFAGLNIDETADALGVSPATVEREWALAKAWLYRQLSSHA